MGILGWEKQEGAGEGDYGQGEEEEEEEEDQEECDVGLGLRMQPTHHHTTTTTTSPSSCVFHNRMSMEVPLQYFAGDYLSGWSSPSAASGGNTAITQFPYPGHTPTLQSPSDCYYTPKSLPHRPLSFSGKMAASSSGDARVPFTAAQWEELERQNLILKHMMASSAPAPSSAAPPVPPERFLPIPATKSFSNVVAAAAPYHPNRSGDPEPWRCRRTDGKKWRCSRDVAPHQKYCERHSHKNRPRSRKPVELTPASSATTDYLLHATKTTAVSALTAARRSPASQPQQPPVDSRQAFSSHFSNQNDHDPPSGFPSAFASSQPFDHPRCLDWFMKGESIPSSNPNQDWQHQNDVPMGSKSDAAAISHKYNSGGGSCISPFQLKQSSPYLTAQHSSLFLMDEVVNPVHSQQTRRFIDAWPNVDDGSGNREMTYYGPSLGKNDLATSSLTLTMCGVEGDEHNNRIGEKPHWMHAGMVHHGLWMGSPPGGPLAEALCLGTIAGGGGGGVRYQASSHGGSSTTTTVTTSSRSSGKAEGQEEFNFIG